MTMGFGEKVAIATEYRLANAQKSLRISGGFAGKDYLLPLS